MSHLGGDLTAFVDGELDHAARERVLVHLGRCPACRGEVDLLRGVKSVLRSEPQAPDDLTRRILASSAAPGLPVLVPRPAARRPGLLAGHARARRTAWGLGALALGVGGALAVAGPPPRAPVAPVDPTSAGFVVEHTSTANEVPFAGTTAVVPVADPLPPR
ncbi:MAG TPA: zf-HC2 domain-containing protein [Mycobacteriales bacterium]|nr:zf-HC2 domain-containing protein [Mycobacteriales bacterium]